MDGKQRVFLWRPVQVGETPTVRVRPSLIAAAMVALSSALYSCAAPGLWTDFTSISHGTSTLGRLRHPKMLPLRGRGYEVPDEWRSRRRNYGTDELVDAVQRAAATVQAGDGRVRLGVGDMSRLRGGDVIGHSSHESGRDVDLIFYNVDRKGRPMRPPDEEMIHFDADGKVFVPRRMKRDYWQRDWRERRFDDARNWRLVEALLADPQIRVQWIFVSDQLRARLLAWARANERPSWLLSYAEVVIRQPKGSTPHDDHFHLRIYCSRGDRQYGCVDGEPLWKHEKKTSKYLGREWYRAALQQQLDPMVLFLPRG